MLFYFGTAVHQNHLGLYTIAMVAAHRNMEPKPKPTYSSAKQLFPAVTTVSSHDVRAAFNAGCNRLIELLLIKKIVSPNQEVKAAIITSPSYRTLHTLFPIRKKSQHWLVRAADTILYSWMRGDR